MTTLTHQHNEAMLTESLRSILPDTARIEDGELMLGGARASDLVRQHGSPLVVYDDATLRAQARAYREAAPDALIVYGTKAFPSLALLRLFAEEGLGADVSTLGELEFARRAGVDGRRLVVHGNNKSDAELAAAAEARALVVLDSVEEIERAAAAGIERVLVRVTPGRFAAAPPWRRADDGRLAGDVRGAGTSRARMGAARCESRGWSRRASCPGGAALRDRRVRPRPARRDRARVAPPGAARPRDHPRARAVARRPRR